MLEKEFKYYQDNQDDFVKEHSGKYLVIVEEELVGVYDSEAEAYTESIKKHELGTFLIQLCSEGDSAYTQSYHSRVSFS